MHTMKLAIEHDRLDHWLLSNDDIDFVSGGIAEW
jgi:hypothetical protein